MKMSREEFEALVRECMPQVEVMIKALEERGIDNLGSLTFSADGYVSFSVYDSGWECSRSRKDRKVVIKHEIELENL